MENLKAYDKMVSLSLQILVTSSSQLPEIAAMQTIFDTTTVAALSTRIEQLTTASTRQWGKMTPYQMVTHCIKGDQMLLRDVQYKRLFAGRIFGRMALKSLTKDDAPLSPNEPTHPDLKIKGDGDLEAAKREWLSLVQRYADASDDTFAGFIHPFFGPMTTEQIGQVAYKHIDHHLRQFGV
ncbi:MAG: DinB family protein [Myxococcota bacterium]